MRNQKTSKKDLISDLKQLQSKYPITVVSRDFYRQHGNYSEATWHKFFPTFKDFVVEAGLLGITKPEQVEVQPPSQYDIILHIRKLLKKNPLNPSELAQAIGVPLKSVKEAIQAMQHQGTMLHEHVDGKLDLHSPILLE